MKTVLITGVTGFLGQYVARELFSSGWKVIGLDCCVPQKSEAEKLGLSDFQAVKLPSPELEELLSSCRPDVIVHAAGSSSVQKSIIDPAGDYEGSVNVTSHLLDAVQRLTPHSRLIFLSSAAVYGNPVSIPVCENSEPSPISPYGRHKLLCENLLREFNNVYGTKTCSLRIFSAYGEELKRQLIWDICVKATRSDVVELHGTGEETRDFIHARDVARAVSTIIDGASFQAEVYNVASGIESRVHDIVTMLLGTLNSSAKIIYSGEQRAGDPLNWCADMDRTHSLGFSPKIRLSDGIAEYARWFAEGMKHGR